MPTRWTLHSTRSSRTATKRFSCSLLPAPFALFKANYRRRLVDGRASIERIRALSWQEFEHLVAEAYRRKGYRVAERGGAGADGGIDIELRASGKTLVVQCKRWKNRTIGVELVRELLGAMTGEQAHGAIFVTTGSYTPDAIDFRGTSRSSWSMGASWSRCCVT